MGVLSLYQNRCSLWLKYGFLAKENPLILVNSIGATLFLCYVIVFWRFTINKRSTCRQLFSVVLVLGVTITYTEWYEMNRTEAIEVMGESIQRCAMCMSVERKFINSFSFSIHYPGYLCCLVTVIFFAAPCCMLLQVVRTRATEILPFPLILMSFLVSVQWFVFGIIIGDRFLQIPNLLGALLSGTQLLLFLIYPNKQRPQVYTPNGDVPYAIF